MNCVLLVLLLYCLLDIDNITSSSMYIRRKDVKLKEKEEILIVEIMQSFIDSLRDNVNHCIMKRKGNKDVDVCFFPYLFI